MISKHLIKFFQPISVNFFYGLSYLFMNLFSPFEKQAVIGDLLGENVFEDILQLRKKPFFVNKFQPLKVSEMGFKLFLHTCDGLQNTKGKVPPDHRCYLHCAFEVVLQTVYTGCDNPLYSIRDLNVARFLAQHILMVLPLNGTIFKEAVGKLLHKKRVPATPVQDEFLKFRRHLGAFENCLDEFGT